MKYIKCSILIMLVMLTSLLVTACGEGAADNGTDNNSVVLCDDVNDYQSASLANMPVPTRGHASEMHDCKIYIFGGSTPADYESEYNLEPVVNAYTGVYAYDPALDQWSQKEPMPLGLYDLSAHTIGDKIYVFGGYGVGGFVNAVMQYDPVNDTWSQKTPMPTYRYIFMSEVVGGKVYVIGGHGTIDNGPWESGKPWEYKSHVEIYDPKTDSWSNGASAPTNIAGGASCSNNGEIYLFGGNAGFLDSSTYVYNTLTDSWTAKAPASYAREGHTCVTIGSYFYLMGGRDSQGKLDTLEIYAPEIDSWGELGGIGTARYWFSANANGTDIYLFGGVGGASDTQINSVEVLDTELIE